MIKKAVPRKHANKKLTEEQEKIVNQIREGCGFRTFLEAKHEYFEKQNKWDLQNKYKGPITQSAEHIKIAAEGVKEAFEEKEKKEKKRGIMTVAETKLGVTMVLSKEECKKLRIKETSTTKEAIQEIRKRLGLPEKKKRGE